MAADAVDTCGCCVVIDLGSCRLNWWRCCRGGVYDNLMALWHSYERFNPDSEAILDSQSITTTAQAGPKESCAR